MDIRILVILTLFHPVFGEPLDYCRICDAERCRVENMACCQMCSAKIRCTSNEMTVVIPRLVSRVPLEDLSFADPNCGGTSNATHFIFKTKSSECGTKMVPIQQSHFIYKNEIRHKSGAPLYTLTCLFERKVKPAKRHIVIKTGQHKNSKLYHTSLEGRRLNKKNVYLDDEDYLFFEVKAPRSLRARDMIMGVKKCQLDITENSNQPGNNPQTDLLIDNGCPVNSKVQLIEQSDRNLWFSYHITNVPQDRNDTAVLNCEVNYCRRNNAFRCNYQC